MKRSGFKRKGSSLKGGFSFSSSKKSLGSKKGKVSKSSVKSFGSSKYSRVKRELDRVFSIYIRRRDILGGELSQCFTCKTVQPWKQMHCGHFIERANMATRWDEDNCNTQCVRCNITLNGNLDVYEEKLGEKLVKQLREKSTTTFTIEKMEEMIKHYKNINDGGN